MRAGLQVWHAGDTEPYVSGVDFGSNEVSFRVAQDTDDVWHPPVALRPIDTLDERLFPPAGLNAPPPCGQIQVIPSTMGRYSVRSYWAYLLYDLGEYGWAILESPYHFEYRRVERTDGGSVVTVTKDGVSWVSLIPLPPAGELVGTPFEILDWIHADAGLQVSENVRVAQFDKYQGVFDGFDAWARAWLDRHGWG